MKFLYRRFRSRRRSRGQGLVEFAIILPVMVLVTLGAIDLGRAMFSWIEVMNASREGAAYAILNPNDVAGIQLRAFQETNVQQQTGEGGKTISVDCNRSDTGASVSCAAAYTAGLGSTVKVTVSEPFTFFTPLMNGLIPNFHLTASATGFYVSPVGGVAPIPSSTPTATPTPAPTATPSASPSASATPTPTATATPNPTATPTPKLCTVPNLVGQKGQKVAGQWTGAGFKAANLTNNVPNGTNAKAQSLGAGTSQPCDTATIIVN